MVKHSERLLFCYLMSIGLLLMAFLPLYYFSAPQDFRFSQSTPVISTYHELPDQAKEFTQKEVFAETEESENHQEKFNVSSTPFLGAHKDVVTLIEANHLIPNPFLHKKWIPFHLIHCALLI